MTCRSYKHTQSQACASVNALRGGPLKGAVNDSQATWIFEILQETQCSFRPVIKLKELPR